MKQIKSLHVKKAEEIHRQIWQNMSSEQRKRAIHNIMKLIGKLRKSKTFPKNQNLGRKTINNRSLKETIKKSR